MSTVLVTFGASRHTVYSCTTLLRFCWFGQLNVLVNLGYHGYDDDNHIESDHDEYLPC